MNRLFVEGNDLCFVYTEVENNKVSQNLLDLMIFEAPLIKIESHLAEKLGVQQGKFYCYYKPQITA